jgi:hypothetical protein
MTTCCPPNESATGISLRHFHSPLRCGRTQLDDPDVLIRRQAPRRVDVHTSEFVSDTRQRLLSDHRTPGHHNKVGPTAGHPKEIGNLPQRELVGQIGSPRIATLPTSMKRPPLQHAAAQGAVVISPAARNFRPGSQHDGRGAAAYGPIGAHRFDRRLAAVTTVTGSRVKSGYHRPPPLRTATVVPTAQRSRESRTPLRCGMIQLPPWGLSSGDIRRRCTSNARLSSAISRGRERQRPVRCSTRCNR